MSGTLYFSDLNEDQRNAMLFDWERKGRKDLIAKAEKSDESGRHIIIGEYFNIEDVKVE